MIKRYTLKSINSIYKGQLMIWSSLSIILTLPYILILYFHEFFKIRDMWSYHLAFHLINYKDFGFVKRGVVGSVIKPIFSNLKFINLDLEFIILITYILLLIIFSIIFWHLCIISNTPKLIRFALLVSPATFQFLAFDSPRTSELVWLILFGIWCIFFKSFNSFSYIESTISGLIISLCLLTYEGSFIIIFPVVFFNILFSLEKKRNFQKITILLFFIIPVLFTLYLIIQHGTFDGGSIFIREFLDKVDPQIPDTLSEIFTENPIKDNRDRMLTNIDWFSNNFIFKFYFFAYLFCNFLELKKQINFRTMAITISSFSGILLCLVALDYSRYIALAMLVNSMNLFLVKKNKDWSKSKYWIIICFMGFLGPVGCAGMINPFPLWKFISDFLI